MKNKMKLLAAFKIWVVIYPSITLFQYLIGPMLHEMEVYQRTLAMTLVLVPWMVFVAMPFLEKLFNKNKSGNAAKK